MTAAALTFKRIDKATIIAFGCIVALLAAGLSVFVVGLALHRYGRTWAERFIRRPPPGVTPA